METFCVGGCSSWTEHKARATVDEFQAVGIHFILNLSVVLNIAHKFISYLFGKKPIVGFLKALYTIMTLNASSIYMRYPDESVCVEEVLKGLYPMEKEADLFFRGICPLFRHKTLYTAKRKNTVWWHLPVIIIIMFLTSYSIVSKSI